MKITSYEMCGEWYTVPGFNYKFHFSDVDDFDWEDWNCIGEQIG